MVFPSAMALSIENYVKDSAAAYANVHSFNQWFDEDWGFGRDGKLFAPAMLSLADRDFAVQEFDFVLARGARIILLPTGPANGRSPGDPYFDPIWSRINEAGATVAFHIMENWYNEKIAPAWGHNPCPAPGTCRRGSGTTSTASGRSRTLCPRSSSTTSSAGSRTSTSWSLSSAPPGCRTSSPTWTRAGEWAVTAPGSVAS